MHLVTGGIGGMDDATAAVAALARQVIPRRAVVVVGEAHASVRKPRDAGRTVLDDDARRLGIAQARASCERIGNVAIEVVFSSKNRCDAALRMVARAVGDLALANDGNATPLGRVKRDRQARKATANHHQIELPVHFRYAARVENRVDIIILTLRITAVSRAIAMRC